MKKLMMLFLVGMLPFAFLDAEDKKESKEKTLTMEDFEKQVDVCEEVMNRDKYKRTSQTMHSLASLRHNLENRRFIYVDDSLSNFTTQSYPVPLRDEIKKLIRISKLLVKQGKAKLIKDGNDLHQNAIDITEKDVSLDVLEKLKDKVEIMRDGMNRVSNTRADLKNTYRKLEKTHRFLGYWIAYRSAFEEEDYSKAASQLNSLLSNTNYYSVVSAKALRSKKAALTEIAISQFDGEVKKLREELLKADNSEKVKKVLNKFQVLSNLYSSSLRNTTYQNELSYTQNALGYWLTVAAYEENGDFKQALNSLRNFDSGYYRNTLLLKWKEIQIKKKALLEKLLSSPKATDPVIESIDERIKECKDVESLIAFKNKVQVLRSNYSSGHNQELYSLEQDLQNLITMYKSLKNNQYTHVFQIFTQSSPAHRWRGILLKQKESIRLQAVAALADIDVKKLRDKEKSPDKVLLELADKAAENKEWGNLYQILNTYAMAFYYGNTQPVWLREEIMGCKGFMTGRNFERAGMMAKAVLNYASVIQQKESKRIPTQEAIERINALRESHPNLFDPETGSLKTPKSAVKPKPVFNPVPTPIHHINGCRLQEELDINPKSSIRHKK